MPQLAAALYQTLEFAISIEKGEDGGEESVVGKIKKKILETKKYEEKDNHILVIIISEKKISRLNNSRIFILFQ